MSVPTEPRHRTIALDFDGVVHAYTSRFTPIPADPPREGALRFVNQLVDEGFTIIYHTARAGNASYIDHVLDWLKRYHFPPGEVTAFKPAAIAYVDDRAVYAGPFTSWDRVLFDIHELEADRAATHRKKNRR